MIDKPVILVSRNVPLNIEARLKRNYAPRLNPDGRLYPIDEVIDLADGADGLLITHTEHMTADAIRRLPRYG